MKSASVQNTKDFYLISEVASILKVSTHTIRNLENEFSIEVKKDLNGRRVYTFSDIEKYKQIIERKNSFDLSQRISTISIKNTPLVAKTSDISLQPSVQNNSSILDSSNNDIKSMFVKFIYSIKLTYNFLYISKYSVASFLLISILSYGSFFLDSYLDIDLSKSTSLGHNSSVSNILQSTDVNWDYRFDVNVPAYFNNSLVGSSAAFDLITVGDRVVLTPSGIQAPNIVNTVTTLPDEQILLVDVTDQNNPIFSINNNPTFSSIKVKSLKGVTALDATTIKTIEENINIPTTSTDAETFGGLNVTDFLRSNTNTVFTNGIMTFNASSSLKFNNIDPNSFLRVDSSNNLIGYTILPGLNVAFDSTATSLTINVSTTPAVTQNYTSVAVASLFFGTTSYDSNYLVVATSNEINKLHTLSGNILTTSNLLSFFSSLDTNASDDIVSGNLASSILSVFPNIDTNSTNDVLISSLASLMLSNYVNLDTNALDDITTSNFSSTLFSLFPNIDTDASNDLDILQDAVLVGSLAGKNVYSSNHWFGYQNFNNVSSNLFEVETNGKIILNGGVLPSITNDSLYSYDDVLYFQDYPLAILSDHSVLTHFDKFALFTTNPQGKLLLSGSSNIGLSYIETGSASSILGMNGQSLKFLNVIGDLSVATTSSSSITFNLNNVNSNTGTFGSTAAIPVITVNSKGLITSISTVAYSDTTNPNNYVNSISFSTPASAQRSLIVSREGLSNLTASFTFNSSDITTALGYSPLDSAAFSNVNITNALGYVPFGPTNFVAGTNVSLSSTATSLTINSSYIDTTNPNNYVTGISFADTDATTKTLTLTRDGLSNLTATFSLSASNITSALGYTPLNSAAFNNTNITNALGYVPFGPTNFVAGTNVSLSSTATSLTINSSYIDTTNPNNYVTGISFADTDATTKTLTLTRDGLSNLTATFSLSASNITSALGYTPLKNTSDTLTGNLGISGMMSSANAYVTGQIYGPTTMRILSGIGSVGAPGYSFNGYSSTGFYYVTDTTLRVAVSGTNAAAFTTTGLNIFGNLSAANGKFSNISLANALPVIFGGTGLADTPNNGQILIGNGTGYTLSSLVAGSNVSIATGAGSITISSSYVDTTNPNNYVTGISFADTDATTKTLTLTRDGLSNLTATFSLSASNITSALGYTPLNSAAFNNTNITNALGYVPFGPTNFVAGTNVSLSSTATSLTINSSYIDTTNPNNYVTGISFADTDATTKTLTLTRDGLSNLTATFSLSASNITSALGYTPLKNTTDTLTGNLTITSSLSATTIFQNGNRVCDITGNCAGLGGSILGSGDAGYLSLFTANNSIANSSIYQAAATSNIGIGTTNPGERLDVYGAIKLSLDMGTAARSNALYQDGGVLYWNGQAVGVVGSTAPGGISGTKDYFPYFNTKDTLIASDFKYISNVNERGLELVTQSKIPVYMSIGHQNQAKFKIGVAVDSSGFFSNYDTEDDVVLVNSSNLSTSDTVFANQNQDGKFIFTFGVNSVERRAVTFDYVNSLDLVHVGVNTTLPLYALHVTGDAKISGTLAVPTFSNPNSNNLVFLSGGNFRGNLSAGSANLTGLTLANALGVIYGGTGLADTPNNGQILIGNGTGYTLSSLVAGSNVSIATGAGSITISSSYVDTTNPNNYVTGISFADTDATTKTLTLTRDGLSNLTATFSLSASNITSALGYTPLNSAAFNNTNITNALGYVPFGPTNFVAGTNVSLSSTATSLTINSSYIDTTNPNNYVTGISFADTDATTKTLTLTRDGLSNLTATFSLSASNITSALGYTPFNAANFTAAYITNALGYIPQVELGYIPLNSAAFNNTNITNALGYVPFGPTNFVAGTNVSLSSTATSLTINSSYIDTTNPNNYVTGISFADTDATTKTLTLTRDGLSNLTATFSLSASNITSALGYTPFNAANFTAAYITNALGYIPQVELGYIPLNSAAFNNTNITNALGYVPFNAANFTAAYITNALGYIPQVELGYIPLNSAAFNNTNITNALGYVPFGPTNFVAGTNVSLSSTATSLTINSSYIDTTNPNNFVSTASFSIPTAGQRSLVLERNGLSDLIATFSLSSNDIAAALSYTPLKNTTDTLTGNLTVTSSISANDLVVLDNLFIGDYANSNYKLQIEPKIGTTSRKLILDLNSGALVNSTLGMYISSVLFSAPSSADSRNLTFNHVSSDSNLIVDIYASGTLPSIYNGVLDTFNSKISAPSAIFSGNLSAGSAYINGYFSAGASSLSSTTISGDLSVNGNFYLAATSTFAGAYFSTPNADKTVYFTNQTISARDLSIFRIGSSSNRVNQGYFTYLETQTLSVNGTANFFGTLSALTININGNLSAAGASLSAAYISGNLTATSGAFTDLYSDRFSGANGNLTDLFATRFSATTARINNLTMAGNITGILTLSTSTLWIGNGSSILTSGDVLNISTVQGATFRSTDPSGAYAFTFQNDKKFEILNDQIYAYVDLSATSGTFTDLYTTRFSAASVNLTDLFATRFSASAGFLTNMGVTTNFSAANGGFTNLSAAAGFLTNMGVTTNFSAANIGLSGTFSVPNGRFSSNLGVGGIFSAGNSTILGNVTVSNPSGNTRFNLVSNGGSGNNIEFGLYNGSTQLAFFAHDSTNTFEFEHLVNNGNLHFNTNNGTTRFYRTGSQLLEIALGTSTFNTDILITKATARITLQGAGASILINGRTVTTSASDRLLKSGIETLSDPLGYISFLRGVTFNWKDLQNPGTTLPGRNLGMIAQEVEEVMPNLNIVDLNPDGTKYIKYDILAALLVEGMKEQQTQIVTLSNAMGSMNLTSMQNVYNQFMTTIENLSMSTENGSLIVNAGLTVTGDSLFNNATFTGDVAIGQIKFDTLSNDISINGMSCSNIDGTLNASLCDTQTLFVMKNKAGNINFFDGKVVINPKGEMTVEKITAGEVAATKVKASEYEVVAGSEVSGNTQLLSGQTEITILTSKIKSNSKVFVTANGDLDGRSLYVTDKVDGVSFKVKLNQSVNSDVKFDWFILNSE